MAEIMRGAKKEAPRTHAQGASKCRDGSLLCGCRLHGPLGEDPEEMLFVLDRALEIRLHVDALGGLLGRGLDRGGVGGLAGDGGLDALGAYRLRSEEHTSELQSPDHL